MSMIFGNPTFQNPGRLIWSGTAARPIDVRRYVSFGFSFEVTADLAADTTFNVQAAPPDTTDSCLPGTFVPVPEVLTCTAFNGPNPIPAAQATITLPAGTLAGSFCHATLPCVPDAFVRLVAGGGNTGNVIGVVTLHGPR